MWIDHIRSVGDNRTVVEAVELGEARPRSTSEIGGDGILDPVAIRIALGIAPSASLSAPFGAMGDNGRYGVFRL